VTPHAPPLPLSDGDDTAELTALQERLQRAEHIIAALPRGIAILDHDLRVTWANDPFRAWCAEDPIGKPFPEVLGPTSFVEPAPRAFQAALSGHTASFRLQYRGARYLDVTVSPIRSNNCDVTELITLCDDVTTAVVRQQQLDALHKAGQELADLDPGQLSEMNLKSRVDLLKQNLRRYVHDLLHYDVIEIRLLDRATKRLEPLLEEGMAPEAAHRTLYAVTSGNGVTGYVAATGQSYLCTDTANDPLYLQGAEGARSSMTVPIIYQDEVIGTFNVESPRLNGFGSEDLQFAELFSRELGRALHTLNLLSAQQLCTATQSIDAVNREIALPLDELLNTACDLLARTGEGAPEWAGQLRRILADARQVKHAVQKVGDEFAPAEGRNDARLTKLKGMRVLVIDREEQARRSVHALLEKYGCEVETAPTGAEGLRLAETGSFGAVISDIQQPGMGGTAVYRGAKARQPDARIILAKGFCYDCEHTVVNARQEGYWIPLIFKPFIPDQLLNALTAEPPKRSSPG
jgi:two-component system, sensor histidine kinase SagS